MNAAKRLWYRIKGDNGFPGDIVTTLGIKVKTNGQNVDGDYIDMAFKTVLYWADKKLDARDIRVEVMPICAVHGKCCFIDGSNHFHGRIHRGVAQASAQLCTIHNLLAQIVTGEASGSKALVIFDRYDWIGKDYE